MSRIALPILMVMFVNGCTGFLAKTNLEVPSDFKDASIEKADDWPSDWQTRLGEIVTLDGWTDKNEFMGCCIERYQSPMPCVGHPRENYIWIENMQEWNSKKRVRVTGKVIVKYDVPHFNRNDNLVGPHPWGVLWDFPEGTDMKEYQRRYLLKNASWKELDDPKPQPTSTP